jgi:hypothetical protein
MRELAVLGDDVGVADGQEPFQSGVPVEIGARVADGGEYGALPSRKRRHDARVPRDTGFRDCKASPAFAASSDTIHLSPEGS